MPFLKLTRDRRGFEHTYLLHADAPGERPRILYWYRTVPEVAVGRPALDEEAIRQIEDQHPLIDFDWPAILALRDAMPPEEEEVPQGRDARRDRRGDRRDEWRERHRTRAETRTVSGGAMGRTPEGARPLAPAAATGPPTAEYGGDEMPRFEAAPAAGTVMFEADAEMLGMTDAPPVSVHGLLEELVGREIATRLRARHAELLARIAGQAFDGQTQADWMATADALDPDSWLTPQDVLDGVQHADQRFDELRRRLASR
ncbi:MAG: hypothetical protein FJW29_03625 [Acidobacteria bacterium]|nr:hypothetical protein [Acidobacteriota bacterium]